MKAIFLTQDQIIAEEGSPRIPFFSLVGASAPATDLALLTASDDGFLMEPGGGINYYLADGGCIDRFGRPNPCSVCAVRPAILLDPGEESLLQHRREEGEVATVEYGFFPTTVLDRSMRDLAEKNLREHGLADTGRHVTIMGKQHPVYRLGAKQIIVVTVEDSGANGFITLSDGTVVSEGELVFLEFRPVRWLYDAKLRLLVSGMALFAGLSRSETAAYLQGPFLRELAPDVEPDLPVDAGFKMVRNETPETINGRAVYNEAKDEIIDIKPAWLIRLERLCRNGEQHILFFDELTNATKQTQSVIFKIVLERFVNNRWPLPESARIVAAGNDRSESSASHDLAEPLFGRFAHIYIRTTVENWMPWAVRSRLNPYVMEFLANNDLYLRTPYTGTEGHADPRRWEMVSKALDASGNDFSLLEPIVGRDPAEAFVRFFRARQELAAVGNYSDEELARFSIARKYQLAQQCLILCTGTTATILSDAAEIKLSPREQEAFELVHRLGPEYEAWFRYMLERKQAFTASDRVRPAELHGESSIEELPAEDPWVNA